MNPKNIGWLLVAAFLLASNAAANATPTEIPLEDFVKFSEFKQVRISPGGDYLAVATPDGKQTGIAILDISEYPNLKFIGGYKFSPFEHIASIYWANDERVLFTTARQQGTLNAPRATGRVYAMNADGKNRLMLHGTTQDYIKFVGRGSRFLSLLREDPDHILLATYAHDRQRPFVERINVDNGRTNIVATSPLENGTIHLDNNHVARFAISMDDEWNRRIAYRESADADWIEKDLDWNEDISVAGFTDDNRHIIMNINTADAMGLYKLDPVTMERTPLLTDDTVETSSLIHDLDDHRVIGAVFEDGKTRNRFFDKESRTTKLYQMLEKAFPDTMIEVTSATSDGKTAVLSIQNDRLPADFFLFDTEKLKADFLVSASPQLDPKLLAERKPISFEASDGVTIHGYLTIPPGVEAENLPMVTIVHGGPHGPRDRWLYDTDAQLLANRGYAVLQVNFRGSGGYGKDFERAGYTRWGTRIQDDIMDGVKWAVDEGIADSERLCVYGASFGGYSAVQQIIRYPDTYKCSFAFIGIYDMELMFEEGDVPETERGKNYLRRVLTTDEEMLRSMSPVHHVDKIRTPLYVAHGEEDVRAHVEHYHKLIEALEKADIPHKKMLVENEGHGFYKMENRLRFYSELVDFIDTHIGD